jgi:acetoin utilization deacetylase AcuC-like enzyme/GNAT superfamily N-acetyltransferase
MFRIRRIHDVVVPRDRAQVARVQQLLRTCFGEARPEDIDSLPAKLHDPFRFRFRTILLVAEGASDSLLGCAVLLHEPALRFCFLDFVATPSVRSGRGVGGALYERVRSEAGHLGAVAILLECLPDDPALCADPTALRGNRARLRFYERYGARPIAGTAYETPLGSDDDCPPYLVMDPLGSPHPLRAKPAREMVRAILERKYAWLCPQDYIERVVASFSSDPLQLRPPRYGGSEPRPPSAEIPTDERIALVVNDKHDIHHVRVRGYVEAPVRIASIMKRLEPTGLFVRLPARHFGRKHVLAVHDQGWVSYFERVTRGLGEKDSVYPYVFPVRNTARPPKELSVRAGYYCIDTFTPLNGNAYAAARGAVDAALTAAGQILEGRRLAYALVRPPGHHAERRTFGGFCYFNSAAIAAQQLSGHGRVALLDLDYHHGNGQQDIFYERADVLTVSIHGHPHFAYPYFSGFADERGAGAGLGTNLNLPLPEAVDGAAYAEALGRALEAVGSFAPAFLVVCLGLDTTRGDPTGTWSLRPADHRHNGRRVGALGLPTVVIQEGGYRTRTLGAAAAAFFQGLFEGASAGRARPAGR